MLYLFEEHVLNQATDLQKKYLFILFYKNFSCILIYNHLKKCN